MSRLIPSSNCLKAPGRQRQTSSVESRSYIEDDEDWTVIPMRSRSRPASASSKDMHGSSFSKEPESMQDWIVRVSEDLVEIDRFYNIDGSPARYKRLSDYFQSELAALSDAPFESYDQDEKVDYLLLKNFLSRAQRNLDLARDHDAEFAPFVEPFAEPIRKWCEIRQRQSEDEVFDPQTLADSLTTARDAVVDSIAHVAAHRHDYSQATGSRAARRVNELRSHLKELIDFYAGYHPSFDYWIETPWKALDSALQRLKSQIRRRIIGGGNDDTIVGEPIGRDGLLVELEAEMIPYSPEELLQIAEHEYGWCEREMTTAAAELGFEEWRDALEHVKTLYEPAATHTSFVRGLVAEGAKYVKDHNLVTVPRLVEEAITIIRIPPEAQRVSPFFLGGPILQIAYPRADMEHEDKLMTLRGNNRHFSRATAFHEMIPGHRLQLYIGDRSRPYRARLFSTPFFVEGWALYWEMLFWNRGDFFVTPEDKVGTLFWRMHRCIRIQFSLSFHLGKISAEECVELLVNRVGHERSTAEGEVRRSFNGSYSPLYQAGYMLGALQLTELRREAIDASNGDFSDKGFHDRILKANVMPIELLRALLLKKELHEDFKSTWKFYGSVKRR
ncbi:hypothetical protein F4808DRAFT_442414 [Astrocystis sublimbata]|nr:hypothetical protein F4808DRAFT_442414 [Astrocystis sublimbata]